MDLIIFLPSALGIALSPAPIIAVILMLFSVNARRNSIAFALGWFMTILGTSFAVSFFSFEIDDGPGGISWAKIILGLILLSLAVKNWHNMPQKGEKVEMPVWMEKIDNFTIVKAGGFGIILSGLNPKNLPLILAGGIAISESGNARFMEFLAFSIISASTIIVPVLFYFFFRERAEKTLDVWKKWLVQNNTIVMFWVLLIVGVVCVLKGVNVIG